jgi:drug/metabolite transporter (DMT)-like permease
VNARIAVPGLADSGLPKPHDSPSKASLAALASSSLFACMAMLARLLSRTIPGHQVALIRFLTGVAVTALACGLFRLDLRPRRWGWLVSRGLFGGAAVLLYFQCIEKIGVGVATLLNYTAPVWSLIFAWLFLNERPGRAAGVALALTLAGVALVTTGHGGAWRLGIWEIAGVLSAALSGMAITSIRATRRQDPDGRPSENSWTVFASFTLLGSLVTLPTVLPPIGAWIPPTPQEWLLLALLGLLSVAAQLLMTSALGRLTAVGIGIIGQTTPVLTLLGGWLLFRETITLRGALGGLLTISGVLWSVVAQRASSE